MWRNYSREESIQGWKLYEEIRYVHSLICLILTMWQLNKCLGGVPWSSGTDPLNSFFLEKYTNFEISNFIKLNLISYQNGVLCIVLFPEIKCNRFHFSKTWFFKKELIRKWYFVTKIVLTYCEKKLFKWLGRTFEIRCWRLKIRKNFEIIGTIY